MISKEERSKIGRNSKQRGHNKERKVAEYLKLAGYGITVRAAGSLGPFDVIGIPALSETSLRFFPNELEFLKEKLPKDILFVQVKSGRPTRVEMEEYKAFAKRLLPPCHFEIWILPFGVPVEKAEVIKL